MLPSLVGRLSSVLDCFRFWSGVCRASSTAFRFSSIATDGDGQTSDREKYATLSVHGTFDRKKYGTLDAHGTFDREKRGTLDAQQTFDRERYATLYVQQTPYRGQCVTSDAQQALYRGEYVTSEARQAPYRGACAPLVTQGPCFRKKIPLHIQRLPSATRKEPRR